jgi:phosphomannomutase
MKKEAAVIGGEGNGGVIDPRLQYGRDSIRGVSIILSLLAEAEEPISLLNDSIPKYHMVKRKLEVQREGLAGCLGKVKEEFAGEEMVLTDGVKIIRKDGWLHVRPSGTEPVLRVVAEAQGRQTAENLCARVEFLLDNR